MIWVMIGDFLFIGLWISRCHVGHCLWHWFCGFIIAVVVVITVAVVIVVVFSYCCFIWWIFLDCVYFNNRMFWTMPNWRLPFVLILWNTFLLSYCSQFILYLFWLRFWLLFLLVLFIWRRSFKLFRFCFNFSTLFIILEWLVSIWLRVLRIIIICIYICICYYLLAENFSYSLSALVIALEIIVTIWLWLIFELIIVSTIHVHVHVYLRLTLWIVLKLFISIWIIWLSNIPILWIFSLSNVLRLLFMFSLNISLII